MTDSGYPLHRVTEPHSHITQESGVSNRSKPSHEDLGSKLQGLPKIYLHLSFAEADPFAYPEQTFLIQPGRQYEIIVTADYNPGPNHNPDLDFIIIRDDLTLDLSITHVDGERCKEQPPEIHIEQPRCSLIHTKATEFAHTFFVEVFENAPACELLFSLRYIVTQQIGISARKVSSLKTRVDGNLPTLPSELLSLSLALDKKRLDHSLLLSIDLIENSLRIIRWPSRDRRVLLPLVPIPKIGLAQFIEKEIPPLTIWDRIHDFRRRFLPVSNLMHWIKNRINLADQNDLVLIIRDDTGLDMPWEMLEINDGEFLGSVLPVARWVTIHTMGGEPASIKSHYTQRNRQVLTFLDDKDVTHTEREKALLKQFDSIVTSSLEDVVRHLEGNLDDIGMLYLGSHGIFTYDRFNTGLKTLHNPSSKIIPLDLEHVSPKEGLLPIFFVNACHSARLLHDGVGPYGLPEVTLGRVASGYIGAIGPIGSEYAVEVAEYVLDEMANNQPIATVLQRLRRRAFEQYLEAKEAWRENRLSKSELRAFELRFLYTFMYVYYGHPGSQVNLIQARLAGEHDG